MAVPSVRLLTAGVYGLLAAHSALVTYRSVVREERDAAGTIVIPAPDVDQSGNLTKGYAVLHPGGGDDTPDNLAVTTSGLLWGFQVSCVGSDHDQVGWVIDEVRELLTGRSLTVAGTVVGRMRPPFGFQAPPPRPEFQATPPRLMVPLQYQVLSATA